MSCFSHVYVALLRMVHLFDIEQTMLWNNVYHYNSIGWMLKLVLGWNTAIRPVTPVLFFFAVALYTQSIFFTSWCFSLCLFPSRPKIAEIAASEQLLPDSEIWVVEMKKFKSLFYFWNTTQFKPHTILLLQGRFPIPLTSDVRFFVPILDNALKDF